MNRLYMVVFGGIVQYDHAKCSTARIDAHNDVTMGALEAVEQWPYHETIGFEHVGNLALEGGGGESPRLSRKDPTIDAYLLAHFNPPRNNGRLAIRLPAGIDSLPYSIDSLLDWVRLEAGVRPVAFTTRAVPPSHVLPCDTAICPPQPVPRDQRL
jgi:hypothetical protein